MTPAPPLPDPLWNSASPELQAAILARVPIPQQRVAEWESRVHDLAARLQLTTTTSSQPPSSDPIGIKRKPPTPPRGRTRGGQPGHRMAHRASVPPEKIPETFDCQPTAWRRGGQELRGDDPAPRSPPVAALPPIEPIVDADRLDRLACPAWGETTWGALPPGVPRGGFGPDVQAVLAVFAGADRLSPRQVQPLASDRDALAIATGMVSQGERRSSEVLEAPYHELAVSVPRAVDVHSAETWWREDRREAWRWVTVTTWATVVPSAGTRAGDGAQALLGGQPDQVVTSARSRASEGITAFWSQFCGAHTIRTQSTIRSVSRCLLGLVPPCVT